MKRVIIIDDEINSREHIKNLILDYCPNLNVVGEADGIDSGFWACPKLTTSNKSKTNILVNRLI